MQLIFLVSFAYYALAADVTVKGILKCPSQYSPTATVFLMERDFSNTPFEDLDEDDTMAFFEVELNKPFVISGSEEEVSELEPYLYVRFNCNGQAFEDTFDLAKAPFKQNFYNVNIDLTRRSFSAEGPLKTDKN